MKKSGIYIKDENAAKIDAFIREREGKARVRLLDYEEVKALAARLDSELPFSLLPKVDRRGSRAIVRHSFKFANSYNGMPYATQALLEYGPGGWRIIDAYRMPAATSKGQEIMPILPASVASEATLRFTRLFCLIPDSGDTRALCANA